MEDKKVVIHTDGGSRGNPGPAGVGMLVEYEGNKREYAECVGIKTNNEAEYLALVTALKKTKQWLGKGKAKAYDVLCYSDSELMVRQLNHQYKLKDKKIQQQFIEIWNLTIDFHSVEFFHVRREQNKHADKLLNKVLDQECSKLKFQ